MPGNLFEWKWCVCHDTVVELVVQWCTFSSSSNARAPTTYMTIIRLIILKTSQETYWHIDKRMQSYQVEYNKAILKAFNGATVIGDKAFFELLDSSSHASICCDAYASCPCNFFCAAMFIRSFHCSAFAWKYAGTHSASLWILVCSSIHRWNWALAQSQCTLLTTHSISTLQINQSLLAPTFIHPCPVLVRCCSEAPDPWKLCVALSDLGCTKSCGADAEILRAELW